MRMIVAFSLVLALVTGIVTWQLTRDNDDGVLHLFEADVSEASVEAEVDSWEGDDKRAWCISVYLGKDSFIKSLELGDQKQERDGNFEVPPGATPKPGQRADSESRERLYEILKASCDRDKQERESMTPQPQ